MKIYSKLVLLYKRNVIFFFLGFFLSGLINAQDFKLSTYQVEQGLPTNLTKAVYQDRNGFMWIGTDVGVLRYDGNNFMHLNNKLASPYVKLFYETQNGDLLVIHDMGIDKIINKFDTVYFSPFLKGYQDQTDSTVFFPKSVYEDSAQTIWIGELQSVVKYKDGKMKRYHFDGKYRTMSFSKSFQFVEDGNGNFIMFSQQGYVFVYDKISDSFKDLGIKLKSINEIIKLETGKIWVVDEEGIKEILSEKGGKIATVNNIITRTGISTFKIDRKSQVIYVGTWLDGAFKLSVKDPKPHLEKIGILNFKVINNFHVNANGDVWASCDEGLALLYLSFFAKANVGTEKTYIECLRSFPDGKIHVTNGSSIREITTLNDTISSRELFLMHDNELVLSSTLRNNTLYFGTNSGCLYTFDLATLKMKKIGLSHMGRSVFSLMTDAKNNIWVCQQESKVLTKITPDNQLVHYGEKEGIKSAVFVVRETSNGIYCGAAGKDSYLYKYDEVQDDFINVCPIIPFEVSARFEVQDLALNSKNEFYLATNNDGLIRISRTKKVEKLDLKQKREIPNIKALLLGVNDGLWIGTDVGLILYYDEQFLLFDEFNGLPSNTISYRSLTIDSQKKVWVGSANGVGYTQKYSHQIEKAPVPVLLSLKMNGKKFTTDKGQKNIFENNSFLQASFVSLSFPSKNIQYQYRVIGIDETWISLNHNELTIPQLTTGKYRLEIRASKQGEYLWSNPLSVDFTIELPWYLHWWAYVLFISVLILIIALSVKLNSIRLIRIKQRLESIIQKRTAEISSQKEEITMQRDAIEEKSNALETALEEIKALNATKDRFFSIVAHDLRGPLNSLSAFSSLLIEHTDSLTQKDIKKVGTQLNMEVKNTIDLTDNLLTWARAQMKHSAFSPEVANLNHIIDQNIILLTSMAQNKGIALSADVPQQISVLADVNHVNFIIRNLISNALKFTFSGGTIQVKAFEKEDFAEISIKDTGVGMSKEVSQKIFNIDSNHSTKGTGGEKGTGLGLSLCRDFVKLNGGSIWVESEQGKGSTFSFTLKEAKINE